MMSLRNSVHQALFLILRYSGLPFLVRELCQRNKVTILAYHAPSLRRATEHFRALGKRYRVISLSRYVEACQQGMVGNLPKKSLIITLDDGHCSTYALHSLLREMGMPVTVFLCSGIVGTHRHFWWTAARSARETGACKKMLDNERLEFLRSREYSETREYPERQALSRKEIEELKSCVDFQSHTVFHPILPACTEERALHEIVASKEELTELLGQRVDGLAFPNGDYTEREIAMVKRAKYRFAVTMDSGYNDGATDLFRLRRIAVLDDSSVSELLVKACGVWNLLKSGLSKK